MSMKQQSKFSSREQQQAAEQQSQQPAPREFATVDDMLRYDASQIPVPPRIAERLQKSTRELPPPSPSWWKRIFGGHKS